MYWALHIKSFRSTIELGFTSKGKLAWDWLD
jgi:hypothetical protein